MPVAKSRIAQHQQSVAGEPATAPKADANSSRGYLSRRAMSRHFRRTELWNVRRRSLRLNARELHHLAPLFGLLGDELAEVGRRARKCGGATLGKPRLHLGIRKGCVDLRVELVDDLGWRGARRADAGPEAKLIARHEFGNRWEVRQHRRACRDGYCQRAKFAGPDVCDR